MFGTKKHKGLIWSVTTSLLFLFSCSAPSEESTSIYGSTQGTTYNIIIVGEDVDVSKKEIDSILSSFDQSLSTYIDSSVISTINNADSTIAIDDPSGFFQQCYIAARDVYNKTNGSFDPSVFPLVKGWGFMNDMENPPSDKEIDSLLQFVSFEHNKLHSVEFQGEKIIFNKQRGFMLDFNAIAQGLSVDVLTEYLDEKGCKNYYVEIGGELRVKGKNREGVNWKIGVDTPKDELDTRKIENILHVTGKAVATSGNYRKFYIKDGVKYSHTLNPATGKPVQHNLLSATVVAEDCAKADAYATAIMVMGLDEGLKLAEIEDVNIEVYLIYNDEHSELQRAYSSGFEKYFE